MKLRCSTWVARAFASSGVRGVCGVRKLNRLRGLHGRKRIGAIGGALLFALGLTGCSETSKARAGGGADAGHVDPVCGEMPCEIFRTPEEAFARVLRDDPRVLAIGESHAQSGDVGKSPTKRFVESFLPLLDGRARGLVVELWVADAKCNALARREVAEVASAQREVTRSQAPKNQSDFLALYEGARRHGLRAKLLVPPCETYGAILQAGTRDIDTMLAMVADVTARDVESMLSDDPTGMVVAYGGAMHNDLVPRPGHARWSFGPRLARATHDRYVELDLVVPENVHDTEPTRAQPWYAHFRPELQGPRTVLFRVRKGSYALVFPQKTEPPVTP